MLSPDDVHNAEFARPWRRSRSYDEDQVDEFLDRVDATLSGKDAVTAHEVLGVKFSPRKPGKRAYKKSQVDAFLDKVALTLLKREVQQAEAREEGPDREAEGPYRADSARKSGPGQEAAVGAEAPGGSGAAKPDDFAAQFGSGGRPDAGARGEPARRGRALRPGRAAHPGSGAQRGPAVRPGVSREPVPTAQQAPVRPETGAHPEPLARPEALAQPAPAVQPVSAGRLEAASSAGPPAGGGTTESGPAMKPAPVHRPEPGRHPSPASGAGRRSALDMAEVDTFMDRVEATLRGEDTLTAQEVLNARFSPPAPGLAGYQEDSVVAFLAMVSRSIQHLAPRERPVPQQRMPIARAFRRGERANFPELTADVIRHVVLSAAAPDTNGYHEDDVDDFLDRVEGTLRGTDTLSSQEVGVVRFRELPSRSGGYDQEEVEVLLGIIEDRLDTDAARHGQR